MNHNNEKEKNTKTIIYSFMCATVVLAAVLFFLLQKIDETNLKYSASVLDGIAASVMHSSRVYLDDDAASDQQNLAVQETLQGLSGAFRESNIELYILNEHGIVVGGVGKILGQGVHALQELGISIDKKVRSNQKTDLTFSNEDYYLNVRQIPEKKYSVLVLLSKEAVTKEVHSLMYFIACAIGAWIVFCSGFARYFMHINQKNYEAIEKQTKKLHKTLQEIPCGIMRCDNNDEWTILDYSESLPAIIGITALELKTKYNNSWHEVVHPDDRTLVENMYINDSTDVITAEYRLLLPSGETRYIMDRTRIVTDDKGSWLWCVIINIDDMKKAQAQEKNMVGRYKHLLEMSDNILYEYDVNNNIFKVSLEFFKKLGYPLPHDEEQDYYPIGCEIIHPDDMDLFMSMQMRIKVGGKVTAALLRIQDQEGKWLWCQLRQTAWTDDAGRLKAIGKIDNVDEETRALQKLQDDVQRDSFTSLYNKVATEQLVNREVQSNSSGRGAFCIIDIDNFKMVNSSFGHAMGDMVIKNLANGLAHIFRSDDIIGRIGGDEFVVYMKNMPTLRPLLLKIDQMQEYFRQTFEDNNAKVSISCSIGIALFPKDGASYDELYRRADKALYRSKMTKDAYHFYDAEVDE